MNRLKAIFKRLSERRIQVIDVVVAVIIIAAGLFMYLNGYKYDRGISVSVEIDSPWLVKPGAKGELYIVDSGKERILVVEDGTLKRIISGAAPRGDTFYYADNICIDDEGGIYVQETGWSIDGFALDYESILKYDAKGRNLGVYYFADYTDIYCDKHRLFGLAEEDGFLFFVSADDGGFALNRLDTLTREAEIVYTREMADAITLIQDFVVNTQNNMVYAIGKRGDIFYTDETSDVTQVYSLGEDPENCFEAVGKTVLYRGAVDSEGNLLVTEIASRRLLRFSAKNDYRLEDLQDCRPTWNVAYKEEMDGSELLAYVADESVYLFNASTGTTVEYDVLPKSVAYMVPEAVYDICFVLCIIAGLFAVLRITAWLISFSYTSTQKIGALIIATVVVVAAMLVYGLIGQFKTTYRDELMTRLTMTAQIIGNNMSHTDLGALENPQNFMGDEYKEVWNSMGAVLDSQYSYSSDFYCNIWRYNGEEGYAVAYLDNSIGTYYPLTEGETQSVAHVYSTKESIQSDGATETGAYIYIITPIINTDGEVTGVISVGSLSSVIEGQISEMVNSVIITMVITVLALMFLFGEVMSFVTLRAQHKEAIATRPKAVPMHVVRALVFITFFAFNMATSFLPVYIIRFVNSDLALPTALANSLPITVNLVFVAITSLMCPWIMGRAGFGKLAVFSGFIAMCGDLVMATAGNYGALVLGLGINGIGVGLITNSIHIYLATFTREEGESAGFSIFNAAILSGINCGILFGSEIAERFSQSSVFLVSAITWLFVTMILVVVGKRLIVKSAHSPSQHGMLKFIFSPRVLRFMLMIQIPFIIMNSFLYYYVPIFGDERGLSEKIISILIILCSLCSVYLSAPLTRLMGARYRKKSIYISGVILFVGMLIFAWQMSVAALVVSLLFIGIANSFGPAMRTTHYMELGPVRSYGEARAMGVFDFVDNLGESTGSLIFASILSMGFRGGFAGFIACTAGLSTIYAWTNRKSAVKTGGQ